MRLSPPAGTRMFELAGAMGRSSGGCWRSAVAAEGIPAVGVTELGADEDTIEPKHKADLIFNLGVSRSIVCFLRARTGEPSLVAALRRARWYLSTRIAQKWPKPMYPAKFEQGGFTSGRRRLTPSPVFAADRMPTPKPL
jgi:hypothetical protein